MSSPPDPRVPLELTYPLKGRIAIVTGASAGIGACLARTFVGAGASVVLNARRKERLQALVQELGPEDAAAVAGDAADESVIAELFHVARHTFGAGRRDADLVVVNAGRGLRGSVYDSDPSKWEEILRTNLLAAARLLREAATRMAGPAAPLGTPSAPTAPRANWLSEPRDIVVLGSSVGRHLSPFSSFYGAAKSGVHMLTESLRRTLGPKGVRVTLLEPGIVRSEFQEAAGYDPVSFGQFMDTIGPVLTSEDIARLIMFIITQPAGVHINDVMIRPTRQEYP